MKLDKILLEQFNELNYINIFESLIKKKTDVHTKNIKLPMGVDGNDYSNIRNNIKLFAKTFCDRAKSGKYLYSPFREMQIPKAPFSKFEFKEAEKVGKLRTLAISTINDTIFQKMIYNAIYDYTNDKYQKIDDCIYGYRKGKSVKQAIEKIQQYFNMGYVYGIDGDIEKYFDRINHDRLTNKIQKFYKNNPLVIKYLLRFLKVRRVAIENKKSATKYYTEKPITTPREIGIPQGGVLSGLLANLYLFSFDSYVVKKLGAKYDIKYIRYADDFIILCKDKNIVEDMYKSLHRYFAREKLNLHPIDKSALDGSLANDNKTKAINLENKFSIEFLGFKISQTYLGVKQDNILKFKKVIKHIVDLGIRDKCDYSKVVYKINAKIMGNWIYGKGFFVECKHCGKPQKPQSWIGFFINITDMRQLKNLDKWIRNQLRHFYFTRYGKRLSKNHFRYSDKFASGKNLNYAVVSLFHEACLIKNYLKDNPNVEFCECDRYDPVDIDIVS